MKKPPLEEKKTAKPRKINWTYYERNEKLKKKNEI